MGMLILSDLAGMGCSGSLFRSIIVEVAAVLRQRHHADLGNWLESDLSSVQLFCQLDVRDLTPLNQQAFLMAIGPALALAKTREEAIGAGSHMGSERLDLLANLGAQVNALASGTYPQTWPNLNGIESHDGKKDGPGWSP